MQETIAIIGAGPTGLMCAIHLAQQGYHIDIYERRSFRELINTTSKSPANRSMSLDLSVRGLHALRRAGLYETVVKQTIAMRKKIFHHYDGKVTTTPYGRNEQEQILSLSRDTLYEILLMGCEKNKNISLHFEHKLTNINFAEKSGDILNIQTQDHMRIFPKIIIGADGLNSTTRELANRYHTHTIERDIFPIRYKSLSINNTHARALDINAMHLWPRQEFMFVAQPDSPQSLGCALLMKAVGENSFATIENTSVKDFFNKHLADVADLMPDLMLQYERNPVNELYSLQSTKWNFANFLLMVGDAVHGMLPFFGQGLNCCFEDCTVLIDCLELCDNDWDEAVAIYEKIRIPDAAAITAMSWENYPEFFAHANLKRINLEREIEALLARDYASSYRTFHNLVCFDRVPYHRIQNIKTLQTWLLTRLSSLVKHITELDRSTLERELANYNHALTRFMI